MTALVDALHELERLHVEAEPRSLVCLWELHRVECHVRAGLPARQQLMTLVSLLAVASQRELAYAALLPGQLLFHDQGAPANYTSDGL